MKLTEEQQARLRDRKAQAEQQTPAQPPCDRHQQATQQADALTNEAISLLSQSGNSTLANVSAHIDRVSGNRKTAVEQVSDVLAHLHDPKILQADILTRTVEKLGLTQQPQVNLSNPYEGFQMTYPVLPTTVAGYLPM